MKKLIWLTLAVGLTAHAEFGVSRTATFNYKADFRTAVRPQGRLTSPDTVGDRSYDDGSVRADNLPGNPDLTRFYSYDQNAGAQVVNDAAGGGSLTLHSDQTILDPQRASGQQSEAQSSLEIYWQKELTENEKFNFGVRAALRWQRIELDNQSTASTTTETISDTYTYSSGALVTDSYDGDPIPVAGYPVLDNSSPVSSTRYASGMSFLASRNIDADLFAFDLGPTLSFTFSEKLRLTASIGGTVAWVDSMFCYTDGSFAQGSDHEQDWLFGAYASADLSYLLGKHWGLFGGAAMTRLQDFDQQADGRSASLEFDDSCSLRFGLFFR